MALLRVYQYKPKTYEDILVLLPQTLATALLVVENNVGKLRGDGEAVGLWTVQVRTVHHAHGIPAYCDARNNHYPCQLKRWRWSPSVCYGKGLPLWTQIDSAVQTTAWRSSGFETVGVLRVVGHASWLRRQLKRNAIDSYRRCASL